MDEEILPTYLGKRRWFAAKDQKLQSAHLVHLVPFPLADREILLTEIETQVGDSVARWQLPLSIWWEDDPTVALPTQLALARVRRVNRVGLLTDGFAVGAFAQSVMAGFAGRRRIETDDGEIRFEATDRMDDVTVGHDADINWLSAEQSNSSLIIGDVAILKLFRRVVGGPHPEAEMSRFLTEHGFANTPPLLGEMVRVNNDGMRHTLAVAQGFVRNQGDAWTWTLDWLTRALSNLAGAEEAEAADPAQFADYDAIATLLGRRLGEMHNVLAQPSDDPAFTPEQADHETARMFAERAERQFTSACAAIEAQTDMEAGSAANAEKLLAGRQSVISAVHQLARNVEGAALTRIHGDLHLGQLLVSSGDLYIIDFEGEPARPLDERRRKTSPLRDVAGVIRSLDYAAAVVRRRSRASQAPLSGARSDAFLDTFLQRANTAFAAGYADVVDGTSGVMDSDLLKLFLLEKAAYEICYEAANRPGWLDVPLQGLVQLVDRLLDPVQAPGDE
jgi:maltose alpha-D-glucosyltransferase/alpha-amylase